MAELPTAQDVVVEDDDDSAVVLFPDGAWEPTEVPAAYHGNSYHLTFNGGAGVNFTFTGEWVWVFIDFNYDHGPYTISVDGGPEMLSSSYSPTQTKSQLVFGREVEPGTHVLTLKNVVDQKVLGIDYFMRVYRPILSHTNTSTTHPSTPTSSTPLIAQEQNRSQAPTKELDVGWYVAIVLGVHVVAILVVGLWMFLRSRRRRTRSVLPVPAITVSTIPNPLFLHTQPAPAYLSRHEQKGRITAQVGRRPKMG